VPQHLRTKETLVVLLKNAIQEVADLTSVLYLLGVEVVQHGEQQVDWESAGKRNGKGGMGEMVRRKEAKGSEILRGGTHLMKGPAPTLPLLLGCVW